MENTIKTITPIECPHCKGQVLVEFSSHSPVLGSVFTEKDVIKAKSDFLIRLNDMEMDLDEKTKIMKYVNDPETIFGPSEVEEIIRNIQNDINKANQNKEFPIT